jgi:hypothetical protein
MSRSKSALSSSIWAQSRPRHHSAPTRAGELALRARRLADRWSTAHLKPGRVGVQLVKVHACGDLANDDRGEDPVDDWR